MNDSAVAGIYFSLFWLLIVCVGIILSVLVIWLYIACFVDLAAKKEEDFKNKTLWLVLLIISFFVPFGTILPIVYYFMYKPRFKFWEK